MKATKRMVGRWLLEVMGRQVPQSVADAKRNAETATPAFVARFEAAAFCQQSQDAIAGNVRYWNEAVVSTALDAWCKENLGSAVSVALRAAAAPAPLSRMGKILFARFLKATDDHHAVSALGLIHSLEPLAFNWVVREDMRAADLVVDRGWRLAPEPGEREAEWDDEGVVRDKARKLMAYYHDAASRQTPRDSGLGTFKSLQAMAWLASAELLTAAVAANARHLLPVLQEEMTSERYAAPARPRLFGGD
jgi:hypothetical protein